MLTRKAAALAKITRPRYSKILDRNRLFALLDRLIKRPSVWIAGPPGSGKTVLASSYIEKKGLPAIWYQVDPGDSDPSTFFYYMRLAAGAAKPRKKSRLPLFTPEHQAGLGVFSRRFFEALYSTLRPPFCIVFDNYQEAAEGSPFHQIIREGLEAVPPGVSVLFLSRSGPPEELSRLCVSSSIEVVGGKELSLTPEETRAIMRLRLGSAGKTAAAEINRKTEGWAAGLVLMLERVRKGAPGIEERFEAASEEVFDYFSSEILRNMDHDTRDLLLKTSFLPDMDAGMAEKLTGLARAGQILSELNRNNYFTEKRFKANPVYQYHPLFREFLLAKARACYSASDIRRLLRRAAGILDESAKYEDAFSLLRDARDYEGMALHILRRAPTLVAQGRGAVLEQWITGVPRGRLSEAPWLLYWLGVCRLQTNPEEASRSFEEAYSIFVNGGTDAEGIYMSWCGAVNSCLYAWRDLHPLDGWIAEFNALRKKYGDPPPGELRDAVASCVFGALIFRQPSHPDLPEWEERVRSLLYRSKDPSGRMCVGHNLILYYLWTGANSKAAIIMETLSPAFKDSGATALTRLMWHFSLALYNYHIACYRESLRSVGEGLALASKTGVHLVDTTLFSVGALSSIATGDTDGAERFLEKMAASVRAESSFDPIVYHHLASLAALNRGEILSAVEHARTSWKMSEGFGSPFFQGVNHYCLTYILLEAGKYRSVRRHIEDLRALSLGTKSAFLEHCCMLVESLLAMRTGDEKIFLEKLSGAMRLGSSLGIKFNSLLLPSSLSALCERALKEGFETEHVKSVIRANNLCPAGESAPDEWPWQLEVRTLGRFEIYRDGVPVEFTGRAQKKPLELLKALIAMGGRDVREGKLTDALWPEAEGDAAHRSFATTLHRLRALLGADRAVALREGMLSLDGRYCRLDVWDMEGALKKADQSARSGGYSEGTAVLLEKALRVYGGDFLPSEFDKDWANAAREEIRGRLSRRLLDAGACMEEAGELEGAIRWFRCGMEIDRMSEELCRRLMICLARLGLRAEAQAVYERLKKDLFSKAGAVPSARTRAVYSTIFSGA